MSGTGARVLTAAVLIPLVVWLVLWGPTWLVAIVVAGIILLALHEFFAIGAKMNMPGYPKFTMVCAFAVVMSANLTWHQFADYWQWKPNSFPSMLFGLLVSEKDILLYFLVGLGVLTLSSRRGIGSALPDAAASVAGFLFIAWTLTELIRLHYAWPELLLFALVVVWAGDTAAFFVGKGMGKHLLAPEISPKKTWEGAVANIVASLLVGFGFYKWQHRDLALINSCFLAILISVTGQLGDLFESSWKRSAGVKDSGSLLPGHGGILDRIDALLLAAPAVWWYFRIFIQTP